MDIYESPAERAHHEQAMEALAAELDRDIEEIQVVYESVYVDLASDAKIKDYLPLFVARRARALLRRHPEL